jgi:thiol-disulfide isomerase/thioredoxin
MSELITTVIITTITFAVIVLAWRWYVGYYPGSKYILEDPPITHNGLDGNQAKLIFFYTKWCPWSTKAQNPWRKFKQQIKNSPAMYGGKTIIFEEVDCDTDKGKAALYRINGYPTFKLETTNQIFRLIAVPDPRTFDVFLKGALGKKTAHNAPSS